MSEYREEDHSQMTKLPLVRREPPVDAVVPGVCTNKGPQRRLHSGASIAGSGSHAPVISTFHGTKHQWSPSPRSGYGHIEARSHVNVSISCSMRECRFHAVRNQVFYFFERTVRNQDRICWCHGVKKGCKKLQAMDDSCKGTIWPDGPVHVLCIMYHHYFMLLHIWTQTESDLRNEIKSAQSSEPSYLNSKLKQSISNCNLYVQAKVNNSMWFTWMMMSRVLPR